jgi:hypothetical protein
MLPLRELQARFAAALTPAAAPDPALLALVRAGGALTPADRVEIYADMYRARLERFTGWGIPFPAFNAALSAYTELIGGALVMLGLVTRLAAIPSSSSPAPAGRVSTTSCGAASPLTTPAPASSPAVTCRSGGCGPSPAPAVGAPA